jgi:hypothetical protein
LSANGTIAGLQLADSNLKVPTARISLAQSRVLIEGLALTAKAKAEADNLDDPSAPKLAITPDQASGESVLLTAKLAGAQRSADVSLNLSWASRARRRRCGSRR